AVKGGKSASATLAAGSVLACLHLESPELFEKQTGERPSPLQRPNNPRGSTDREPKASNPPNWPRLKYRSKAPAGSRLRPAQSFPPQPVPKQIPKEQEIVFQVAGTKPPRFSRQSKQPGQTKLLHPGRSVWFHSCIHIKRKPNCQNNPAFDLCLI